MKKIIITMVLMCGIQDCNCNCVTTASPTEPTGATNASCQPMTGIGLFTF